MAAEWPDPGRRRPRRTLATYAVRAPLARWVEGEARAAASDFGRRYRVLDVGCGPKPYYPFFEPYVSDYVGVDVGNAAAELEGAVEALPVPDGSFDLVLCTQVLEHADDPRQAVRELRRVLAPGGRVLASTHGTQVYHPNPGDYWRWTHAGLDRLFREEAEWAELTVEPGAGTASCLAMLLGTYVALLGKRVRAGAAAGLLVAGLNRAGEAIDRHSPQLSQPGPGTLFANFHVLATAAGDPRDPRRD